jgi:signal transduction histidine kinase
MIDPNTTPNTPSSHDPMTDAARTPYPLGKPLPADVVAAQDGWLGYRRYPVFGWRWLWGRSLVFGLCIGVFALITAGGLALTTADRQVVLYSALHFFIGFMLICSAGPLLATLVRHAHMPVSRERGAVVAALVVGIVAAYFADSWASGYLESVMPKAAGIEVTHKPPKLSPVAKAIAAALQLSFAILIYGLLGGGLALRAYFRELGRWREARQAEALASVRADKQRADLQLGVLQAQVEPHFLFNTLASVRALLRQDADRAEKTLDALVDYLRATIPKLRDDEARIASTLGQQLDLCASYLEVMRIRTDGRLRHAIEVDAALRALPFPPMLLITLVENAIKHGVEPKPGPGRVTIEAAREGDGLRVSVIDDGLGLDTGVGSGLGLANVRAQLETLYPGRARFSLQGEPARGVRASLWVPVDEATA